MTITLNNWHQQTFENQGLKQADKFKSLSREHAEQRTENKKTNYVNQIKTKRYTLVKHIKTSNHA